MQQQDAGILLEHLGSTIPMVKSIYLFHVYYQIRKILKRLQVALPFESGFHKYWNNYNRAIYHMLMGEYGIDLEYESLWKTSYSGGSYQFISSPRDVALNSNSWSRWILDNSRGLTRVGISKLS